ncbi:MAG TPA: RNA polymerase sigma factor SigJ [Micropepsaceae bacterium]|nr:RNA polymerase sigma factor SigJ [Micropepsaceae bacterium]
MNRADPQTSAFEAARPRLMRLAYRMLGDVGAAEDIVQNAWLKWQATPMDTIAEPAAWLAKVTARLAIDELRAARRKREIYAGPFLPEPVTPEAEPWSAPAAEASLAIADDLSVALFLVLERLSPDERAAFLLREAFDADYGEIAAMLGKSEAACRKIIERAREHVADARPRYSVDEEAHRALFETLLSASASGNLEAIKKHLRPDAILISDGGGKRAAALNPIYGDDKIARFLVGTSRKRGDAPLSFAPARVNGLPSLILREDGVLDSTISLELGDDGRIARIYIVRNPDKLERLG